MIHLRSVQYQPPHTIPDAFPFSVPPIRKLDAITFEAEVTFFVGENGSGKSTLMEALAAAIGSITVGGDDLQRDKTLGHARRTGAQLKLTWQKKTGRGFFLRAEDFFNFARRVNRMSEELEEMSKEFEGYL